MVLKWGHANQFLVLIFRPLGYVLYPSGLKIELIKIEISVYFHVELLVSPVCIATQRIISNWRKYQCLEYLSKMEMILINSQGHCKMLWMYMNIGKHACWNFCYKLSKKFFKCGICKKIFGNCFELERHVYMPHFGKKKVYWDPLMFKGVCKNTI